MGGRLHPHIRAAALSLLVAPICGLVQNNELVFLPIAGLGLLGAVLSLVLAHAGTYAAARFGWGVWLAVRS